MTKCKSRISCLVLRNESVSSQHDAAFAAAAASADEGIVIKSGVNSYKNPE